MIEAYNLTKVYPGVLAVDDVSFEVGKGEIVGFLGPNGAGKTTTMRILSAFLPPTYGSARIAGYDCVRESRQVRLRIGYLPENNPLYGEMRVDEYLRFRATIKGVPGKLRKKRIAEILERCSLQGQTTQIIETLSHGYRQRVGLADALLAEPEVLILDEPTLGLDPNQVRGVRTLIREIGENHTVLLSTHILPEVEKLCGRVLIMNQGRIAAEGTPDQISERLTKTGRLRLVLQGEGRPMKEALDRVQGVFHIVWSQQGDRQTFLVNSEGDGVSTEIVRLCGEKGWRVLEFGPERLSLEDVFAAVTAVPRMYSTIRMGRR